MLAACFGVLIPTRDLWVSTGRGGHARAPATHPAFDRRTAGMLAGGCACLAITTAILLAAPQSAVVGVVALIAALLLLLPRAARPVLAGFERLQRPFGSGATALAVVELRSPKTRNRSIAIAATGAVAVFGSVTIQGSHANLQSGLDRLVHECQWRDRLVGRPAGRTGSAVDHLVSRAAGVRRWHDLAGVGAVGVLSRRVSRIRRAQRLGAGAARHGVLADPAQPTARRQPRAGDREASRGRLGGISKTLADQHHLRIGQTFVLPSPRSPTRFASPR